MKVREACNKDFLMIRELDSELHMQHANYLGGIWNKLKKPMNSLQFYIITNRYDVLVLVDDNDNCIGFAECSVSVPTNLEVYCDVRRYVLKKLIVREDYRHTKDHFTEKTGAKMLLDEVDAYAKKRNCQYVFVQAYVKNECANELYLNTGFKMLYTQYLKEV